MPNKVDIGDILALSPAERILLVEQIWDSIRSVPESLELTDDQREELRSRLAAHRADPQAGMLWEDVLADLRSRPR